MDEKQLQAKLAKLKGDILLAEKNLNYLKVDIEHHQQSKSTSLREYDQQIKRKKEDIQALTSEGERLRALITLTTQALEDITSELESVKKERTEAIQNAHDSVLTIHSEAKQREEAVKNRENNVKMREEAVKNREILSEERIIFIESEKERLKQLDSMLDSKFIEIDNKVEEKKTILAQTQELLENIKRVIKEKKSELDSIDKIIAFKRITEESLGGVAEEKMKAAERKISDIEMREKALAEERQELHIERLRLNDLAMTLRRSQGRVTN